jgi:3-oxoacyl-[acyl-carrier protein] reductase
MDMTAGNGKRRIEGMSAIVTGGSRGIGKATALALAREGAKVAVNYRQRGKEADEVLEIIHESGGEAFAFQADVADRDSVQALVDETVKRFGRVDILVNNAGIGRGSAPLSEFREEDFDAMVQTNVKGVLFCAKAVIPFMIEKRYGKIVNISSLAGLGTALAGNSLYAATKASVMILTKRLALELGPYGVNVNCIAPGLIRTDMSTGDRSPAELEERFKYFREKSMLGRIGEPEDIANAVLFLASDEANFITGQVLSVDGGRTDFLTHSL